MRENKIIASRIQKKMFFKCQKNELQRDNSVTK